MLNSFHAWWSTRHKRLFTTIECLRNSERRKSLMHRIIFWERHIQQKSHSGQANIPQGRDQNDHPKTSLKCLGGDSGDDDIMKVDRQNISHYRFESVLSGGHTPHNHFGQERRTNQRDNLVGSQSQDRSPDNFFQNISIFFFYLIDLFCSIWSCLRLAKIFGEIFLGLVEGSVLVDWVVRIAKDSQRRLRRSWPSHLH